MFYIARMLLEEQRFLHEDLERLEQGIADRTAEEPKHVSNACTKSLVLHPLTRRDARFVIVSRETTRFRSFSIAYLPSLKSS